MFNKCDKVKLNDGCVNLNLIMYFSMAINKNNKNKLHKNH